MYIDIIRQVVKAGVSNYAHDNDLTEEEVLTRTKGHIDRLTAAYFSDGDPRIDYENPLCRLGYLYKYAPAHATLFEHVLAASDEISFREIVCRQLGSQHMCRGAGGQVRSYLVSPNT